MMAFLVPLAARMVGPKLARPLIYAAIAIMLFGGLGFAKCSYDARKAAQARADAKAAEAYATSAGEAVNAVAAAAGRESALKDVVTEAAKDIAQAEGSTNEIPPAARSAALRAACRLPAYRNEPACKVQ